MEQLPLDICLAEHAVFATYHAAGNELVVHELQARAGSGSQPTLWLWGAAGTGKSHLLQAVAAAADDAGLRAAFVPLADVPTAAGALEGLEEFALLCVDDLEVLAGDTEAEGALFRLWEAQRRTGGRMVLASRSAPADLRMTLRDLDSRLRSGLTCRLQPLDERGTLVALQGRARFRGFELPAETGAYLLARHARSAADLFRLLDTLDRAALSAQRRLTIPFVRQVMGY